MTRKWPSENVSALNFHTTLFGSSYFLLGITYSYPPHWTLSILKTWRQSPSVGYLSWLIPAFTNKLIPRNSASQVVKLLVAWYQPLYMYLYNRNQNDYKPRHLRKLFFITFNFSTSHFLYIQHVVRKGGNSSYLTWLLYKQNPQKRLFLGLAYSMCSLIIIIISHAPSLMPRNSKSSINTQLSNDKYQAFQWEILRYVNIDSHPRLTIGKTTIGDISSLLINNPHVFFLSLFLL